MRLHREVRTLKIWNRNTLWLNHTVEFSLNISIKSTSDIVLITPRECILFTRGYISKIKCYNTDFVTLSIWHKICVMTVTLWTCARFYIIRRKYALIRRALKTIKNKCNYNLPVPSCPNTIFHSRYIPIKYTTQIVTV